MQKIDYGNFVNPNLEIAFKFALKFYYRGSIMIAKFFSEKLSARD